MEAGRTSKSGFTDSEVEVYEAIAVGAGSHDDAAVERLHDLRLVESADGLQAARDPRVAAHTLLGSVKRDLIALIRRIEETPNVEVLTDVYEANRMYGGWASELVPSKGLMNERIQHVISGASAELMTCQPRDPVDRDPEVQRRGVKRDRELLGRGARVRYLYSGAALEHEQTVEYVSEFLEAGGEVRVGIHLPPRMVLVDGRHQFVGNYVVEAEANAGWHVTDVASVAFVRQVFEGAWEAAVPWERARASTSGAASTARQREILRHMEHGDVQQHIAERTGWSERVINRELANLRQALGMRSTYQVMVWWATSPERDLP